MIKLDELRPGNYVFMGLMIGCEDFSGTIVKIRGISNSYLDYTIDYPDSDVLEDESASHDDVESVPLNKEWKKLLNVNFAYPPWIKSVHELQNWYYWNNEKKELDTSKVPMSEGDNVNLSHLEELLKAD